MKPLFIECSFACGRGRGVGHRVSVVATSGECILCGAPVGAPCRICTCDGLLPIYNIAVGVVHALEYYGLQRIAIVDFDVHHGNGTEEIFRNDERVMLCSTFQHPFYPNCGADSHRPNIVNVP